MFKKAIYTFFVVSSLFIISVKAEDEPQEIVVRMREDAEKNAIRGDKFFPLASAIKKAMIIASIKDHDMLNEALINEEILVLIIRVAADKCKDEDKLIPTVAEVINASYNCMTNWPKYIDIFLKHEK